MVKKRVFKVVIAMLCIATLILPHTSVVLAAALTNENPNDVNEVNLISSQFHEGGAESSETAGENYDNKQYIYKFGGETDILKIVREDDKDETTGAYLFSDAFYCLDGNNSFPTINGSIKYSRTIADLFAENPSTLGLSDSNYNSLCWVLDNMYLRKQMTAGDRAAQKDALLTAAFAEILNDTTYEDSTTLQDIKTKITDDDIEVIQQWAIWYFTNNGEKTLQDVDFVQTDSNGKLVLPNIDLTTITLSTDSMDSTRKAWLTTLYQYFVNTAIANKDVERTTTQSTYPTIANKTVTSVVDGNYYKVGPFKVTAPSSDLTSNDYEITLTDGTSELLSSAYTIKDADGNNLTGTVKTIFDKDYYIYLPIDGNTITTLKLNLSYTKFGTKASVWQTDNTDYQPLVLLTKEGTPVKDSVSAPIIEAKLDLALRKYIVAVNDTEITDRAPNIDTSKLADGTSTTAEYKHKKSAVEVGVNSTVTYRIAVYNEGNLEGKVTEIVDYLPAGLEFIADNEINKNYGWTISEDGRTATTTITKDTNIPAFEDRLRGLYVDIVCKITDTNASGTILTNIAEIKAESSGDRDSTPDTIKNVIDSIDKSAYIGDGSNKTDLSDADYFYKGQEDDDDFEKVKVIIPEKKPFDLSLQKFITKVNGKAVKESREPVVDVTPLKNGSTNATYTTIKTPVVVKVGDIVTYTIRVYNEGEADGYAERIADYLPDGLGYLVNYNTNIDNYWALPTDSTLNTVKLSAITNGTKNVKLDDFTGVTDLNNVDVVKGAVKLSSTALSKEINSNNLIKAFDNNSDKLSYKDIEVACIVLADANLKNIAEVTKNGDEDGNDITDRDSTPDTVKPDNYPGDDQNQDDNDYELLTMKKFDLSLQKFITGVNDKEIKDRVPTINYKDGKITYKHPDTALEVNNGDLITYTIRVYNEGEIDGYAAEVMDDIPAGLTFVSDNETNKKYGWVMYDSNKNVTNDPSKATQIRTDYLSKEKSEARKENTLIKAFDKDKGNLSYMDVKVVFKVNSKSSNETIINTAEITKNTDEDGNDIEDIDSTPDNGKDGEDDIDKEKIHLGYFDLALQKDLVKAVITEDSTTREINAVNGQLMKVEINRKKINSTIVKFVYNITIKNEGTIPGYAKEIKDYIPDGLQFVESDNTNWKASSDGVITTDALANTLIQPGETATVQVVLRWINGENNLGMKTNVAEISQDYNDANDTDDIDSTPDNKKDGEDDIDDAPVILSISTGSAPVYIILTTTVLAILGTGIVLIKKYVL